MTDTKLLRGVGEGDEARAQFIRAAESRIPMGRLAAASDIADAIVFLLSDAASFITGQALPVNGGAD
jgi:3-oxoacyl-[acyl-carrier protein] reductase